MHGKGLPREPSLLLGRSIGRRLLSNVTLGSLRQYTEEPLVNEIVTLAKIRGLGEFGRVGGGNSKEARKYRGEFDIGGGGNSKATIFWHNKRNAESVALCIEKHHSNDAVTMRATNLIYDNAV
ncbi:hypothetical protein AVEN_4479-1 [Araneus ventricosus]|uniref:Uncharacterized protein n=1 Tax=Araneus ventricosus TaxID=182803 RepID=A0A4Y2WPV8_ARAVE|nr:hypothetical protein AVEN_4479-1 [Araneus ventricosus]